MGAIATPELAAAVSEAGGLGMISLIGFPTEKVVAELQAVRKLTSRPFGANFLIPNLEGMEDLGEIHEPVRAAAKQARLVEFFYRDPDAELVRLVHSEGALAGWQVGSKQEASAALDADCDIIIVQGIEAGGHVRGRVGLLALLDEIVPLTDIPVVAAGGIGSGRVMAAALVAGAAGVRVGTRFVAAEESTAHPTYQDAMLKAEAKDSVYTDLFSKGWNAPGRVLRACIEAAQEFKGDVVGERYLKMDDQWHPIQKFQGVGVTKEIKGNILAMSLWAGEGVGNVRSIQPAKEIVKELATEAEKFLRQWTLSSETEATGLTDPIMAPAE